MTIQKLQLASAAVTLVALIACGGADNTMTTGPSGNPNPTPAKPGTPTSASLQGGALSNTVGSTVPIRVSIVDSAGVAVPGALINFVITSGAGSVFAPAVQSSSSGVASNEWKLGTKAGNQTLEARWVDPNSGVGRVLGVLTATASPGPFERLDGFGTITSAFVGFKGTVTQMFGNRLRPIDAYNNPISLSSVQITGSPGLAIAGDTATVTTAGYKKLYVSGGSVRDSAVVSSMEDMRRSHWRTTYRCFQGYNFDSLSVSVTSDSITYNVQPPTEARNATFWVYFRGTVTSWWNGTTSKRDTTFGSWHIQLPDSIEVQPTYAVLQPDGSYLGGSKCSSSNTLNSTLRLERF